MQPLPEIAGAAGAAMGCIQIAMGAAASGLVATLYASLDDRPDGPVLSLGAGGVSVVRPPLGVRRAALNRIALRFSGSASPRANEYNFVLRHFHNAACRMPMAVSEREGRAVDDDLRELRARLLAATGFHQM
jgi:hypothetical protein